MKQILGSFAVLAFMALLAGCEFEPAIDPLVLPDAPPQAFQSAPEEGAEIIESEQETAGGGFIGLAGFDSTQAIAMCGDQLTWGNESVGMCDVPGSDTFYLWISAD